MGCDYYIFTILKIVHTNGTERIILDKQPMYLNFDTDPMSVKTPDIFVYKKREPDLTKNTKYYLKIVKDEINYHLAFPSMNWGELQNVDDILEMYVIETREGKN